MRLDEFDSAAIRAVLDSMAPFILQEGQMYQCLNDIRVKSHDSEVDRGTEHLTVEEGTIIIPCRDKTGDEAILIGGVIVPFPWSSNSARMMFAPVEE